MSPFFTRKVLSLAVVMVHVVALGSAKNVVLTKQGFVKGMRQDIETYKGQLKYMYKFLGVPYAEKPIGNLRFKRPQPLKSWRLSTYNATYFRPICIQESRHYGTSIKTAWPEFDPEKHIDEDCLYLNIYTPSIKGTKRYPVIFYIHGGSYVAGTPVRDVSPGELIPLRGVVLVTVQYRLGTFGFFSTGDSEAPGNLGLLDQVEALKWVQENIHAFGGNKSSVTLLGESAGGSSVSLHYLSPLTKGLFHRGIAVSGVDFSPFAFKPKSKVVNASRELLKKLNCAKETSAKKVQCVQSFSTSKIIGNVKGVLAMQPFVDNYFLPDEPMKLRKGGRFQKLPLISGFVRHEGSFTLKFHEKKDYSSSGFRKFLEGFIGFHFQYEKDEAPNAYNALEFQYTPWADQNDYREFRKKFVKMVGDYNIMAPTHAALTMHSDHVAPTYMFEFAHRSQYHPKPKWMGVVHEDTTAYKFGLPLFNTKLTKLRFDEDDKKVSEMTVTMFLNFAKFGNPTPSPVYGTSWNTFNSSNKAYLKIQKTPVMTSKYHPLRMAFWNSYFPTLLPAKTIPPSSGESKKSEALCVRGSYSLAFAWIIVSVCRRLLGLG